MGEFGGTELVDRFKRHFGAHTWVAGPNPLSVSVADINGSFEGFAFKVFTAGGSESDACQRLERFLAECSVLAAREEPPVLVLTDDEAERYNQMKRRSRRVGKPLPLDTREEPRSTLRMLAHTTGTCPICLREMLREDTERPDLSWWEDIEWGARFLDGSVSSCGEDEQGARDRAQGTASLVSRRVRITPWMDVVRDTDQEPKR